MDLDTSHYKNIDLQFLKADELVAILGSWGENEDLRTDSTADLTTNPLIQYIERNTCGQPLRSVINSVWSRWRSVVLIEKPYLDTEFWHSHAGLYEWCFKPYAVSCVRLHFFALNPASEEYDEEFARFLVTDFKKGKEWPEIIAATHETFHSAPVYVGYCILRPTPSYVVSRTSIMFDSRLLSTLPKSVSLVDEENALLQPAGSQGEVYDGCPRLCIRQRCHANLMNASLSLYAPEFLQQDPGLGACATASIWVATRSLGATVVGTAVFPYTTIGRQATGGVASAQDQPPWDPAGGDIGLSTEQIRSAVSRAGWHLIKESAATGVPRSCEADRMRHVLYSYLDSAFPVLLCAGTPDTDVGHAVAAVGMLEPEHLLPSTLVPASEVLGAMAAALDIEASKAIGSGHFLMSSAVEVFYAHDDVYGPYNRVVLPRPQRVTSEDSHLQSPVLRIGRVDQREMPLRYALVPLPPDVRHTSFISLMDAITRFQYRIGDVIGNRLTGCASKKRDLQQRPSYVWRSLLIMSSDFKNSLRTRGYGDDAREWYASLHFPKYVWVHEFTILRDLSQPISTSRRIRNVYGEYIYDATSPYFELHFIAERSSRYARDYLKSEIRLKSVNLVCSASCCSSPTNSQFAKQSPLAEGNS